MLIKKWIRKIVNVIVQFFNFFLMIIKLKIKKNNIIQNYNIIIKVNNFELKIYNLLFDNIYLKIIKKNSIYYYQNKLAIK